MADRKDHLFEIVRRGYDVDEVGRYLDELNAWWKGELEHAVSERDRRIAELEEMTADVATARHEREKLAQMLDDAAEQRRQILEEADHKATRLVSDTEREMARLRRETESAMAELRVEADAKKDEKLSAASSEARSMIDQAKATIASMEKQSQRWLTDEELATKARIESLTQEAERNHNAKLREYARLENDLSAHIGHLQNMRDSLIASLEAIARGALQSAEEAPPPETLSVAPVPVDNLDDGTGDHVDHDSEEQEAEVEVVEADLDVALDDDPSIELSA